jgi:TolB protein
VFVRGGFRQVWHNKTLYRADTALWGSTPLHRVRGTVQLDPAFSPNGKQIAFVQARDIGATYLNGVANLRGWIRTRRLWVMNAAGSGAHEVSGAGPGVYSPMWSRDGRHILYVRRRAIWLIDAKRNAATQIVRLSPRSDLWPGDAYGDYYGYTAWSNFLAWYKR